jgi:hypothetical protein
MAKLYTGARMTTATAGTGTIALGAAVSGYLTFALAGVANGDSVFYGIKDGANSEWGFGTYTASGTTLTRNVISSTNSNAPISLSGAAEVYITALAEGGGTPGAGILSFVSATQVKFAPCNGERVKINGLWYDIPSGGITAANTGVFLNGTGSSSLAASTLYYVYLFNNSGTLTIDFSTTGHATSTTAGNVGTEIKSADDTRSLIGMVRTNASAQFQEDGQNLLVASWFNRRPRCIQSSAAGTLTTTSTTYVELSQNLRLSFLTWAAGSVLGTCTGFAFNNVGGNLNRLSLDYDGAGPVGQACTMQASVALDRSGMACAVWQSPAEGFHFLTVDANTTNNTGSFVIGNNVCVFI